MNLAVVLVHNKSDAGNAAQIEALKPLIQKQTETHQELGEDGSPTGNTFETYHYTLQGLPGHQVKFYQIIPFGVTPPPNLYDIDSHKVFYGKGDEDKTGDHPRFFNWALKRATDYGADVVVHLRNAAAFNVTALAARLNNPPRQSQALFGVVSRKDDNQITE